MHQESNKKSSSRFSVEYTAKPVSGWGGTIAFGEFLDGIRVRDVLTQALPDGRKSNNRVDVVDMVLQFLMGVLIGGKRFEHVERVRWDEALRLAIGARRLGSASSLTRYLGNFLPSQTEHLQQVLTRRVFELLPLRREVLDLDSTVITRYGKQEGSVKGYNPKKKGASSHQPLLAMFAGTKTIPHAWLRAGSASAHRGVQEFLTELVDRLPNDFEISAVRADSGFYSRDFLSLLEQRNIPYVIAAKMSRGFAKWCASQTRWRLVGRGVEITSALYQSPKERGTRRRMVIVRTTVRRTTGLFEIIDYEYQAYVTTLRKTAVNVWRFYKQRGDCENRIKELKYDFGADGFCLHSFSGTEAALRLICFLFNVFSIFKSAILKDSTPTLATIRHKLFVIGAIVGASGRKIVLRLGLVGRWRDEFEKLRKLVAEWSLSTAAQLSDSPRNACWERPSPWRLRTNPMLFGRFY